MDITAKRVDFFPQFMRLLVENCKYYSHNRILATIPSHRVSASSVPQQLGYRRGNSMHGEADARIKNPFAAKMASINEQKCPISTLILISG
jgi:hypothetical protein